MKIGILGAGWLGLPLAKLLQTKDWDVRVSTTSSEKNKNLLEEGFNSYILKFEPELEGNSDFFKGLDILFLNIPPRRRTDIKDFYPKQIQQIQEQIIDNNIGKVLFISSTSVYGNENKLVTEQDELRPDKPSGVALIRAEQKLQNNTTYASTVLRFAGLVGPNRHPGRFFAGKQDLPNGQAPVNMIHQTDCLQIIEQILLQNAWNLTLNACADKHPTKQDFYKQAALHGNFVAPTFTNELADYKTIDNSKLKRELNYKFQYPDPNQMHTQTS